MVRTTRRLLTGPLLAAALGTGLLAAGPAAEAAPSSATIRVDGTLMSRSGPTLSSSILGELGNGDRVQLDCTVQGQWVRGSVRTTATWDRLTNGRYVPHAYVQGGPDVGRCVAMAPEAVPVRTKSSSAGSVSVSSASAAVGRVRSSEGSVNLRSAPSTAGNRLGTLANGARVSLACGVWGQSVVGTVRTTRQWDRTVDGHYVSHAYVLVTPALHLCRDAGPGPAEEEPNSSMTTEQFVKAAVPGAQRGWREFGVPPSVTIAQAILESGWGRSGLASTDRNYFGIKCFGGQYGTIANGCHTYHTTECTKAGTCFATSASFRTYARVSDSFRDHGSFLRYHNDGSINERYLPAFAYTRDANRFIWQIWKSGYATDPNYYTKITGVMAANGLYQYDTWK